MQNQTGRLSESASSQMTDSLLALGCSKKKNNILSLSAEMSAMRLPPSDSPAD
jgi:hypothetical protein